MKDTYQIFEEYFLSLVHPLEEANFRSCGCISNDIILYSEIVGFDDGVFIGEVFESIFLEIDTEITRFQASDENLQLLIVNLRKFIGVVSKCYVGTDKNDLYTALKEMRLITTKFQYVLRRENKLKPQHAQFPFSMR
ncbi:MAG: hypothetical protein STSR0009_22530 [Methanoregula sp.]